MPIEMTEDEFEGVVQDAIAQIPPDLQKHFDNIVVFIEDRYIPGPGEDPNTVLLGLYHGIPLTERGDWYAGEVPDSITIYRLPLLEIANTREELVHEVLVTVKHEFGHYFGIDDGRLHELGWG
ncbi:metallopeptidase family protein [Haematomicrobium sanguinis]|uniref:metallopeptidase family protein n=1 Tax=Haematomicrobium sanguinis TaxID=479106 RepID=UPI000690326B|nr:metallopeptidase family protein [Haematomicrobium sanguinis]